ncbi:hypothetical protein [Epilithonimonas caeni]|uniref:hypothetical protein n=1 Tax=Epilithonimonas caeni TaxID=365343 RepID=UPI00040D7A76|nr:hypothetical protein [Epilithonimonas caeni]
MNLKLYLSWFIKLEFYRKVIVLFSVCVLFFLISLIPFHYLLLTGKSSVETEFLYDNQIYRINNLKDSIVINLSDTKYNEKINPPNRFDLADFKVANNRDNLFFRLKDTVPTLKTYRATYFSKKNLPILGETSTLKSQNYYLEVIVPKEMFRKDLYNFRKLDSISFVRHGFN